MLTFVPPAPYRPRLALLVVLALSAAALAAIFALQGNAADARDARVDVAALQTTVATVNAEPLIAAPTLEGMAAALEAVERGGSGLVARIDDLRADGGPASLDGIPPLVRRNLADLESMFAVADGDPAALDRMRGPWHRVIASATRLNAALEEAGEDYAARADAAALQARIGTALVVAALLAAFGLLYVRMARARCTAERLRADNERLLAATRVEARSDPLTGLGNRRALLEDLAAATERRQSGSKSVLVMLDLDGFKAYNDEHGHPAGDALLDRLGRRLVESLPPDARAYRLGGDEFCVLARADRGGAPAVADAAVAALDDAGETAVAASHGVAVIPCEAATPSDALRLADRRMYAHKRRARPARRR